MQVTSIGMMKNWEMIKRVDLQVKTRKMVKVMKILQGLRLAKLYGPNGKQTRVEMVSRIPFETRQKLHHYFELLDTDRSGDLKGEELQHLFKSFGITQES